MKLATLNQGGRDGRLIVVSRDLSRYVPAPISTLQAALDDWSNAKPVLTDIYDKLNANPNQGEVFDPNACHSPPPQPQNQCPTQDAPKSRHEE